MNNTETIEKRHVFWARYLFGKFVPAMANKLKVGVLGATGMVGQRFVSLLADHPWFEVTAVAASAARPGRPMRDAVAGRWTLSARFPSDRAARGRRCVADRADRPAGRLRVLRGRHDAKRRRPSSKRSTPARNAPRAPTTPRTAGRLTSRCSPPESERRARGVIEAQRSRSARSAASSPSSPTALCKAMCPRSIRS